MSGLDIQALPPNDLAARIENLLIDPRFLHLHKLKGQSNIFETLAVSHLEMWNSAFVRWLIDPTSDLRLGDFPLKRFLGLLLTRGDGGNKPELDIGMIEQMKLDDVQLHTEANFPFSEPAELRGRLDIIGVGERNKLRIIVENKIDSTEGKDQTKKYYAFAEKEKSRYVYDFLVFLTADKDDRPKCEHFIHVNYQQLCDGVIKPCLSHPGVTESGRYMLEQYLHNLGKGDRIMAQPNIDICKKIYESHKEVLDEIFVAVRGVAPASGRAAYNISLTHLVENGAMSITDILYAKYKNVLHEARLVRKKENGEVRIDLNGDLFDNPSKAGKRVRDGKETAGWDFWTVKSEDGTDKGTLAKLREQVMKTAQVE